MEQRREDRGEHGHRTVHEPHHLVRVRARVRVRLRLRLRVRAPASDHTQARAPPGGVEDGARGVRDPLVPGWGTRPPEARWVCVSVAWGGGQCARSSLVHSRAAHSTAVSVACGGGYAP